jgi:rhodanese-related sulfurtransferase
VNQNGPPLRRDIQQPPALDPDGFAKMQQSHAIIDARSKEEYSAGHIPGSLSNAFRDAFAVWLGWLVPAESELMFVTGGTPVDDLVDQSLLVGYERFAGWLDGGIRAWAASGRELATTELVDASRARKYLLEGATSLDVREKDEYRDGHVEGALNVPLGELAANAHLIPRDKPVLVYCGHGERASTAASLLEMAGFRDLINLDGGLGAWQDAGLAVTQTRN